jgi:microcystin-dependent protein
METFIGQICIFSFNFAPQDWAFCDGRLLQVSQNQALYSLLGITYGGTANQSFALPDLRGRLPIGMGAGPGLTARNLGVKAGQESTVLTTNQVANHSHSMSLNGVTATTTVKVATEGGNAGVPASSHYLATGKAALTTLSNYFNGTPAAPVTLGGVSTQVTIAGGGATTGTTGAGQPVPLLNPVLAINFCIALVGIYPTRP